MLHTTHYTIQSLRDNRVIYNLHLTRMVWLFENGIQLNPTISTFRYKIVTTYI